MAWILSESVSTSQGWRFRVRETAISPPFPEGIYDGAAGVALVLGAWVRATGDPAARAVLREVADGLVASATPRSTDATLYFGDAGLVTALLHTAAVLRAPDLRDAALDHASVLLKATWQLPDLLYGPAGTGLVALQLHRASGDRQWLRAARHAFRALDQWALEGPIVTGMAHGAGGILLFLDEVVRTFHSSRAERLRTRIDALLDVTSRPTAGRGRSWPKALGDERHRHHWCHGTAGLALLYANRARRGSAAATTLANEAARHAWASIEPAVTSARGESACHCHGLAGTLDALVAVERLGARWTRGPIARLVDALGRKAGVGKGATPFGLTDAGLEMGASGVVFALMRASGYDAPAPWDVSAVPSLRGLRARGVRGAVSRTTEAAASRSTRPATPPDVLPPVVAEVRPDVLVVCTSAADGRVASAARRLLDSDRAAPIRESWIRLSNGLRDLGSQHRDWLHAEALAPEQHLALMQRIAGITLHGEPDRTVQAHRAAVARTLVDRHLRAMARALDRVAVDRLGLLAPIVSGRLLELMLLDADPHHGGQRSVALRFARGPELVLKPRDVRLDGFVVGDAASNPRGAAARLNARLVHTLRARIPTHALIGAAVSHGYAERLASARVPLDGGPAMRFTGALDGAVPPPEGHVLRSRAASQSFWRSAGALAAHLAAFGVSDQHAENVFLGSSASDRAPRLHAIDCEVAFSDGIGVGSTQLVPSRTRPNPEPGEGPHSHYGLDARRWELCGFGAPLWTLVLDGRGRLVPVEPPGSVQRRLMTPIVIAPDGSSGYGAHVGAVVRGAVEHWLALRAELPALVDDMRRALRGVRVRVLRKTTADYVLAVTQRELGSALWPGALAPPRVDEAREFDAAELAQLDAFDVPAFGRAIGRRDIESVAARATTPDALARAVGELAAFNAPAGTFTREDSANGVTVLRADAAAPIELAVALPRGVAQFRLEPDGAVTHWGLPRR